ncbi:MAG TPA: hypothetical protein VJT72_03775 [Pseudonocardiaceae bacterium]|nr:hypothetical protein [Pseudonocardiaceae bacterium]
MAVARFQLVRAVRYAQAPTPGEPGSAGLPAVSLVARRAPGFCWRFMSANNRSLARSAQTFADVESCLAAIRILQENLPRAVGETARNGNGQWVWRIRLADEIVATTTRTYQRQVRARLMCDLFLALVTETVGSDPVQVIYR